MLFDLVVGASSIYGGSWLEGAGAVHAENEALRWIADLAGLPAGGRRVLRVGRLGRQPQRAGRRPPRRRRKARDRSRRQRAPDRSPAPAPTRRSAVDRGVMDVDVIDVPVDERGRLTGDALAAPWAALDGADRPRAVAVVATAGTTNAGIVDDLAGVGRGRPRARPVVPRRRRLRRRGAGRAERPAPLRRRSSGPTRS